MAKYEVRGKLGLDYQNGSEAIPKNAYVSNKRMKRGRRGDVHLLAQPITSTTMDDDDYLSELTDDYEEDTKPSSSKKTRGGKADSGGYRIRGALSAPRATTYNAQHIYGERDSYIVMVHL